MCMKSYSRRSDLYVNNTADHLYNIKMSKTNCVESIEDQVDIYYKYKRIK